MRKIIAVAVFATITIHAVSAVAGVPPADKCEASKNKEAGSYYACREKAEAKAIAKGGVADYSKCTAKFDDKWGAAESKGGGACPDNVLTSPMNDYLAAQAAEAASVIGGASIPTTAADLQDCQVGLAICSTGLTVCAATPIGQIHKTGQTSCADPADLTEPVASISCTGTGQDGAYQKGVANSFTDNGDGTVTDNKSGLQWEKLDDNNVGGVHDLNLQYTWAQAFSVKIAHLNVFNFAGHNDWRLPNVKELQSLTDFSAPLNAFTFSTFNTGCAPSCTVLTCSCSSYFYYWSSTSYPAGVSEAWSVGVGDGITQSWAKTSSLYVRAVRGGS